MTCVEHYFENLLIHGEDIMGNPNRDALSDDERRAVETCYYYVIYTLFEGREDYNHFREERKKRYPYS